RAGCSLAGGREPGSQRLAGARATNAADVFGLRDRGRLSPGMAADICVIGPAGLTAHATYDEPRELATGVDLVLVNGTVVWRHGRPGAGQAPGRLGSSPHSPGRARPAGR